MLAAPSAAGTDAAQTLAEFVALVKTKLAISDVPWTGDPQRPVLRVAIACGSGGEFLSAAVGTKCDVLLTGEARFHASLEARAAGIGLVLAGHYATERPAMEYLSEVLARQFPGVIAWASQAERDPVQWQ
jgi:putative NIF3 family GTP cyclohydrolase 1 type 2